MGKYFLHRGDTLIQTGECPDGEEGAQGSGVLGIGEPPPNLQYPAPPKRTYVIERAQEYPPLTDYIDAQVKKASSDPVVRVEGKAQERTYIEACLAVKEKYPKNKQGQ